jgi:F-type H+-transporting ATPase subunit b
MYKKSLVFLTTLALMALAAGPALAAEAEGGEASLSPFAGDFGNALWTLIIFVLVLVVLGKYAWGPILSSLQTRETFIRESLETAQRDRQESERRLREYEERLAQARTEATAIVEEGRRDAATVRHKIEEDARREADKMIERAKREIQIASEAATKDLYSVSARLATELAARILSREISPQDHQRLISEAVDGMGGIPRH